MAEIRRSREHVVDAGWGFKHGLIGGIIAGIIFAVFEMVYAWLATGNPFGPLRLIAGIPLAAPPPQIELATAILVGVLTHMVLSIVYGVILGLLVATVPALRSSRTITIVVASIYGLVLWLVNFFVLAPLVAAPWFVTEPNQFWQGFVAHTFFFGTVLGWYLASRLPETYSGAHVHE